MHVLSIYFTSLIIGLATEKMPMPPVASAAKVMPSKWNCGDRIASAMDTSCTGTTAAAAVEAAAAGAGERASGVVSGEDDRGAAAASEARAATPPGTKEWWGVLMARAEPNMRVK